MIVSPIGQFVLYLHERSGNTFTSDPDAARLLDALRYGYAPERDDPYELAGLELRSGVIKGDVARAVRRVAKAKLEDLATVLAYIDAAGYTTVSVRALLEHHFIRVKRADLGSDAHCAYLDLRSALDAASAVTQLVAALLISGYGAQEVGKALQSNGSRQIGRALSELARRMEGTYGEAK